MTQPQRRSLMPHPLVLMSACIVLAGALTHVVPAGRYERAENAATGREMVVAGSYARVAPSPLGALDVALAVPKGIIEAADVLAVVFLVGGAFVVVERTGALHIALAALAARLRRREALVIPVVSLAFATAGALVNLQEEIIALTPVLVLLAGRLGLPPLTAVAMSLGAAFVGSSFSPVNPFQVGIAQQAAGVPLFSGSGFRLAVMAVALSAWVWGVHKWGRVSFMQSEGEAVPSGSPPADGLHKGNPSPFILLFVGLGFAAFIIGLTWYDWSFNELSAVFLVVGILSGLAGGLGFNGTADAYVEGFRDMAYAALLIGFARGIFVALNEGQIVDTIVHGLSMPLAGLPPAVAAVGMMFVQAAVHVPVPSVSGQAVLTLPILAPLSDLLGISRQIAVLAYQYGAGLCEILTPTNGALMAVLAAARVGYDEWMTFAVRMWVVMMAIGAIAILAGMAIGLG